MLTGRYRKLTALLQATKDTELKADEKYVIFSDHHRGGNQFEENQQLYCKVLKYYLQEKFRMILLGDVEENSCMKIMKRLEEEERYVYRLESRFGNEESLRYYRIWGNHDYDWSKPKNIDKYLGELIPGIDTKNILPGLKLKYGTDLTIFLTHGHLGECHGDKLKRIIRWIKSKPILRCIGHRASTSQNHRIRWLSERQYYEWAKRSGVLLITGHTHRPRFESLSKLDRLQIRIENLCREWSIEQDPQKRIELSRNIETTHKEYRAALKKAKETKKRKRLGQGDLLIPCYFNPGSCIHKKGITCLEISDREIRLVFYFDLARPANQMEKKRSSDTCLSDLLKQDPDAKHYVRRVLETENLEYTQVRIQLLTRPLNSAG